MRSILLITTLLFIVGCKEDIKKDTNSTKVVKEVKKESKPNSIEEVKDEVIYTEEQLILKEALDNYLDQLKSLNTDGIVDMTYPKLFIPINKNIFKRYIDTLLTSPQIAIESFETDVIEMGDIEKFSSGEFALIKYRSSIKLTFINPELYSDKLSIRVLNDVLTSKYGEENIEIDPQDRTIIIRKDEKLLAINEESDGWKFIGDNREYRRLYPQILPEDILNKI